MPSLNLGEETVCARVLGTMGPWDDLKRGALLRNVLASLACRWHARFQRESLRNIYAQRFLWRLGRRSLRQIQRRGSGVGWLIHEENASLERSDSNVRPEWSSEP